MNYRWLVVLNIISLNLNSQPLETILKIDSIRITSVVGSYQFDGSNRSKGKRHVLIISPCTEEAENTSGEYRRMTITIPTESDTEYYSNIKVRTDRYDCILINELISQLLSDSSTLNSNYTQENFQHFTTPENIKKVSKRHEWGWQLKSKYTTRQDIDLFYTSISSKDTFDIFIEEFLNRQAFFMFTTDYTETMSIELHTNSTSQRFTTGFPRNFYQPWVRFDHSNPPKYDQIFNIRINEYLDELLPPTFLLKSSIETSKLYETYIQWFFKRRDEYIKY